MRSDRIDFNHTEYQIGVVKCTEFEFQLKVGLTRELCDSSKTLSFKKGPPLMFVCHYKSMAHFKEYILDELRKNDYQNFGNTDKPDIPLYYFEHRFILFLPKIPVTRL